MGSELMDRMRSLVGIFAHPDDESLACGGLLAWCAELGVRVSIVCATRGELRGAGDVARTRTLELEAAARVLGVSDVIVLDHQDGMLPWVDAPMFEAEISSHLRRLRPDVVVTFDEDGLYWHPDHIAIHERTTAAVAALGGDAPALYYVSLPPGRMRAVAETAAARNLPGRRADAILGVSSPDAFGFAAPPPTLVLETGAFAVRKLAAIRCHRSQLVDDALEALSDEEAVRLLGTEHFRHANVGAKDKPVERTLQGARSSLEGARVTLQGAPVDHA